MTHPRLIMMSNRTEKSSPTQDKTFRERGGTTDTQQAKLDSVQKLVWKNRARLLFTRFSHYFCEQFNTASPDGAGGAERSRAAGGRKRPPLPAADLGRQRSEESFGSEQTLLPNHIKLQTLNFPKYRVKSKILCLLNETNLRQKWNTIKMILIKVGTLTGHKKVTI